MSSYISVSAEQAKGLACTALLRLHAYREGLLEAQARKEIRWRNRIRKLLGVPPWTVEKYKEEIRSYQWGVWHFAGLCTAQVAKDILNLAQHGDPVWISGADLRVLTSLK